MPIHDSRQQHTNSSNSNNKNNQLNSSLSSDSSTTCRTTVDKSDNGSGGAGSNSAKKNHKFKDGNVGGGDTSDSSELAKTTNNKTITTKSSVISTNRQANDGSSASAMSNLSSDYYIDDDHIDDQETINVGNLIIDLESDLEKEKIENEQQANAKPNSCSSTNKTSSSSTAAATNSAPTSSSNHSSYSSTTSSATSSTANNAAFSNNNTTTSTTKGSKASSSTGSIGTTGGKSNQKSSAKGSVINSNNNNNNNQADNGTNAINSSNNNSNNGHPASSRAVFKSSSDERGELKMRITRETMPGKSEHKIVTSPNQKSPTSSSNSGGIGGNSSVSSAYANMYDEAFMQKSPSSKPSQSSSISSTKECGTSTSIGTITEPECLGPCEPGTSVTLEGIVWQETEGGILVVNVTWRGKTYVGALLDCTKHDWAPPRLCDSPASDIDSKTSKGVRTKRIVTRSNGIGLDEKNLLQTTGKLRNGKGRRILAPSDLASCSKRQRDSEKPIENASNQLEAGSASNVSSNSNSENLSSVPMNIDTAPNDSISTSNITSDKLAPNSPMLIGCNEPNCSKKYRNMNGLLYHQTHAHGNDNDSSTQENNCSSSIKSKNVSKDDQSEELNTPAQIQAPSTPEPESDHKQEQDVQNPPPLSESKREHTVSQLSGLQEPARDTSYLKTLPFSQEIRHPMMRGPDFERKNPSISGQHMSEFGRKSPGSSRHLSDHGHGTGPHSSNPKQNSGGGSKPPGPAPAPAPAPAPMPPTTEEGMKPSGTSTGPPPAPHQANCFFNPAFMANTYNPYLSPYFPRMPLPPTMYDSLNPATSSAFLSRMMGNVPMGNVRPPPPPPTSESSSRMLSPSIPKNLPYPPFKMEPGMPPMPPSQMVNPVNLPAISPMTHPPPMPGGSPHLRMPSQGDPLMPPTSQAPLPPPPNLNPLLGLPGPMNHMGPFGGPPSAKFGG